MQIKCFDFTTTPLFKIEGILQAYLQTHKQVSFSVPNPDNNRSVYNGNSIVIDKKEMIHRGYKSWLDLAHFLHCRMLTPYALENGLVEIRYEKLYADSFHNCNADVEEKYGQKSLFATIYKNEESGFVHYYKQALENVNVSQRVRILNLGVNNGDEFELIRHLVDNFSSLELVGIDYCASAIASAKEKFAEFANVKFYIYDIQKLDELELGKFDLIISIGTLQSSNLSFHQIFMKIVQNSLKKEGSMILGFPNCRWRDGEMVYGAKMKNYIFSEMSNLYKDVTFCKKYLQQKKFRVTVTGKDYIFVTATSIR